jgi:hypothetical protein
VETAQSLLHNLVSTHLDIELTIVWVPGHEGVEGNEAADFAAKEAAEGISTDTFLPIPTLDDLPKSAAAVKAMHKRAIPSLWHEEWSKCKQLSRISEFDARPPSFFTQKYYNGRSRARYSPFLSPPHQSNRFTSVLAMRSPRYSQALPHDMSSAQRRKDYTP